MARAPLSDERRRELAHFVYVGRVEAVRPGEADIAVEEIEEELLPEGWDRVTVRFDAGPEPGGAPGPAGQHSPLREGTRVRVFFCLDAEGRAYLLEPNGWEPAE